MAAPKMKYKMLFSPTLINGPNLENRVVMAPTHIGHITYLGGSTAQVSLEKDVSLLSNKKFCSSLRGPRQSLKFTLR